LLVLDFDRDKANVKRRFFEGFPLTERLMADKETVEAIRDLARDAQDVRQALVKSLTRAHDTRKHGGLALADAESAYWGATEEPFLHWLEKVAVASDASDNELAEARAGMGRAIRRSALAIFDEHVSLSEFDPRKAEQVAGARRTLRRALYPKQPRTPATAPATEVTP
jgi:hypothetical protein